MSLQHAIQCMTWRCNPLLQKLVNEGKIKYVGMSEASPAEIKKAHSICPLTAIQIEYSLWSRDVEGSLTPSSLTPLLSVPAPRDKAATGCARMLCRPHHPNSKEPGYW